MKLEIYATSKGPHHRRLYVILYLSCREQIRTESSIRSSLGPVNIAFPSYPRGTNISYIFLQNVANRLHEKQTTTFTRTIVLNLLMKLILGSNILQRLSHLPHHRHSLYVRFYKGLESRQRLLIRKLIGSHHWTDSRYILVISWFWTEINSFFVVDSVCCHFRALKKKMISKTPVVERRRELSLN